MTLADIIDPPKMPEHEARQLFREMLLRYDNPQAGDAEKLPEVLRALGMQAIDFRRMKWVLDQIRQRRQQMISPQQIAKTEQQNKAAADKASKELREAIKQVVDSAAPRLLEYIAVHALDPSATATGRMLGRLNHMAASQNMGLSADTINMQKTEEIRAYEKQYPIVAGLA